MRRVIVLLVVLASGTASAKSLYVNNSGSPACSDSTTYAANDSSHPWCAIGRATWGSTNRAAPNASQAAQAGDTVIVSAGTYTTTGTISRQTPAYNPVNSGTVSNPIIFSADAGVILTYSSGIGPAIGSYLRNYITWKGFSLDESLIPPASDTGPVVVWDAIGVIIENCTIDGNEISPFGSGELHNGVRINGGSGTIVRNNYINGFRNTGSGSNASAILVDQSAGGIIEHNEIVNSDGIFFIKRNYNNPGKWIVRYNYAHDNWNGIRADQLVLSTANPDYGVDIYQNVLVNVTNSAFFTHHYDSRETFYVKVVNNTVKNSSIGFEGTNLSPNAGHVVWNNIFVNTPLGYRSADYSTDWTIPVITAQHNMFRNMTNAATFRFELTGQTTLSFASWQALGQDVVSPASQIADPLFVNETALNFKLASNSPARTLGVDTLDLDGDGSTTDIIPAGAYITGNEVIGISSAPSTTLSRPTNLRTTP